MFNAPQPRSRLYTKADFYLKCAAGAFLGVNYEGKGVSHLEQALVTMMPGQQVIAVPMCRVGIYLALKNTIRKGQKVILSPYTISDVVNMVLCAGGVPLFADIEEGGSCNIDARDVAELVESEDNIGAVLVTHFYGLMCNLQPIMDVCRPKGIPVIEDAAQAFGAVDAKGRLAGTIADVGVFSFGLLKNVTSFIGGAVVTRDDKLASAIRRELAQFPLAGKKPLVKKMMTGAAFDIATMPVVFDAFVYWLFRYAYLHDLDFFNNKLDTDSNPVAYSKLPAHYSARLPSMQADIIASQLDRIEGEALQRRASAELYDEGLSDIPQLVLPPLRKDGSHTYFYYTVQAEDRDRLAKRMTEKLRDVQISHHRNCASMPCFAEYYRDCPNAEKAMQQALYLPTYPGYRADQVSANVEAIRSHFRESNRWT